HPEIVEEWKWAKATSPGTPVWSRGGIVCTGETYKSVVKLTFAKGGDRRGGAERARPRRGRAQSRRQAEAEAPPRAQARGLASLTSAPPTAGAPLKAPSPSPHRPARL